MTDRGKTASKPPDEHQLALMLREDMKEFNRNFPNIWERAGRRHLQLRGKIPAWSFLTTRDADLLLAPYIDADKWAHLRWDTEASSAIQTLLYQVGALATWRFTQGVYRFDPDVFDALWETPLTGKIPTEVLTRLPEPAVYIPWPNEGPRLGIGPMVVLGFMVIIGVTDVDDPTMTMSIFLHRIDPDKGIGFHPITIPFVKDTIEGSLESISQNLEGASDRLEQATDIPDEAKARILGALNDRQPLQRLFVDIGSRVANLIAYLATQNETYAGNRTPTPPKVTKVAGKKQIQSPNTTTIWDVAVRVGQAIRAAKAAAEEDADDPADGESGSSRREVRPHIRRAHWHGFWTGPINKPDERKFELRWLPPIPVKVKNVDDLPAVIRPVLKEAPDLDPEAS